MLYRLFRPSRLEDICIVSNADLIRILVATLYPHCPENRFIEDFGFQPIPASRSVDPVNIIYSSRFVRISSGASTVYFYPRPIYTINRIAKGSIRSVVNFIHTGKY